MLKTFATVAAGAAVGIAGTILYRKYGPAEIPVPTWFTRATNRAAA
jgi:hypothetical protein